MDNRHQQSAFGLRGNSGVNRCEAADHTFCIIEVSIDAWMVSNGLDQGADQKREHCEMPSRTPRGVEFSP